MRNFMTNLKNKIDWVGFWLVTALIACLATVWYAYYQAFQIWR